MTYIVKTQFLSVLFSIFWVLYLNIIAFFDQPGRAMEHINIYVYGFAALFLIIDIFIIKYFIRGDWSSLPLVLIPELVLYQPVFLRAQSSLIHGGFNFILHFLSDSLGMIYFLATAIGLILGIMFGRMKRS